MNETIGRYRILRRLGVGGMAEVYLASSSGQKGFEKRVAIKRIHADLSEDPAYVQLFADEARLVAQLSHPNIVQVFEFEHDGRAHFLVMEYVEGLPLSKALRLARDQGLDLPPAAVVAIGVQVCDALSYAHTALAYDQTPMDIVHRDIKPANLMLTSQGQIKVADFGIARAATNLHQTMTGSAKGTPAYMAPEQLEGKAAGPPADLFSLGSVLYELITGELLFDITELSKFMERRVEGFRSIDRARVFNVAPELVPVIERSLALEPEDRFASAREMAEALRALNTYRGPEPLAQWSARLTISTGTLDGVPVPAPGRKHQSPTLADPELQAESGAGGTPASPGGMVYPDMAVRPPESPPPRDPDESSPMGRLAIPVIGVAILCLIGLLWWRPWAPAVGPGIPEERITADQTPGDGIATVENPAPTPGTAELATPETETAEPVTAEPATPEPATPEPATEAPTPAVENPTPDEPPTEEPAVTGSGFLTVTTTPWAMISIDEVERGSPGSLVNLKLSLGEHSVRVSRQDLAIPDRVITVTLTQQGEKQTWNFREQDGAWQATQLR